MEWKTLATFALALGSVALGALVPAAGTYAFPIATLLLGLAAPQPKTWFSASDPKALPKAEEPPK